MNNYCSQGLSSLITCLYEAKAFLRNSLPVKNSPLVMEPAGSLPCLHNPVICPYPKLHESSPLNPILFLKDHCNNIFPSTPRSINRILFLSPNKNPVSVSLLRHTCHVPCPFFRHIVRKCRNVQMASAQSVPVAYME